MLDCLQAIAVSLRFFGRTIPGVALIYVREIHRFAGRFLQGPGRLVYPSPPLFVGRTNEQGEQVSQG
jgi:hypothetical protein